MEAAAGLAILVLGEPTPGTSTATQGTKITDCHVALFIVFNSRNVDGTSMKYRTSA